MSESRSVQAKILQMVESGAITAVEATRLLDAAADPVELDSDPKDQEADSFQATGDSSSESDFIEESQYEHSGPPAYWHSVWVYLFATGAALAGLGAAFTVPIVQGTVRTAWLWLTIPAMVLGTLLAVITWWSRSSRWLHLRIQDEGKAIRISLPIPLHFLGAALHFAEIWSPELRQAHAGDIVSALATGELLDEELLHLHVDDGESGEKVQISIG